MSLSFHCSLTPAQSKLLLACAFGHYSRQDNTRAAPLMPDYQSPFFFATANCLKRKKLLTHDPARQPSFMATPAGVSVAHLIAAEAREVVELAETARPLPKAVCRRKATSAR